MALRYFSFLATEIVSPVLTSGFASTRYGVSSTSFIIYAHGRRELRYLPKKGLVLTYHSVLTTSGIVFIPSTTRQDNGQHRQFAAKALAVNLFYASFYVLFCRAHGSFSCL